MSFLQTTLQNILGFFLVKKKKFNVLSIFSKLKIMVEKYFNTSITMICSDGGGEYHGLKSLVKSHGIQHLFSPPHTLHDMLP